MKIKIEHPEKKIPKTVLAESIVKIGKAMEDLKGSGLNEEAIVVLLHNKLQYVGKPAIRLVFQGMRQLEGWYCK